MGAEGGLAGVGEGVPPADGGAGGVRVGVGGEPFVVADLAVGVVLGFGVGPVRGLGEGGEAVDRSFESVEVGLVLGGPDMEHDGAAVGDVECSAGGVGDVVLLACDALLGLSGFVDHLPDVVNDIVEFFRARRCAEIVFPLIAFIGLVFDGSGAFPSRKWWILCQPTVCGVW